MRAPARAAVALAVIAVLGAGSAAVLLQGGSSGPAPAPAAAPTGTEGPPAGSLVDRVGQQLAVAPDLLTSDVPGAEVTGVVGAGCSHTELTAAIGADVISSLDVCVATLSIAVTDPGEAGEHGFGLVEVQTAEQGTEVAAGLSSALPADRTAVANGRLVLLVDRSATLAEAKALAALTSALQTPAGNG